MCTSDTGQHGGEGVLYILTVNLNTGGNMTTIINICMIYKKWTFDLHVLILKLKSDFETSVTTPLENGTSFFSVLIRVHGELELNRFFIIIFMDF